MKQRERNVRSCPSILRKSCLPKWHVCQGKLNGEGCAYAPAGVDALFIRSIHRNSRIIRPPMNQRGSPVWDMPYPEKSGGRAEYKSRRHEDHPFLV